MAQLITERVKNLRNEIAELSEANAEQQQRTMNGGSKDYLKSQTKKPK
jgi:hypothetical protein